MGERKGTKALELWCKRLIRDCPNVQIENMTTSWRNGMAFCALVHHFRPDLIEMSTLKPENIYENNQLAFSIAEKHLGIPALLDPEDMVANDVPDRLSILTYLSQFYQRLGHTVSSKSSENESSPTVSQPIAVEKFGKTALDKCASCELPVYLAQRLIVSQKLYHRRCFRCFECSGHLNPNNFKNFVGTQFICDSCKNNKSVSKFLNNNDVQMGMLEFTDNLHSRSTDNTVATPLSDARRPRPQSILDKISMFEKPVENTKIDDKLESLTLKDDMKHKSNHDFGSLSLASTSQVTKNSSAEGHEAFPVVPIVKNEFLYKDIFTHTKNTENVYKSDVMKNSFLKSQLLGDTETDTGNGIGVDLHIGSNTEIKPTSDNTAEAGLMQEFNVTDDTRLANSGNGNQSTASLDTELNKPDESTITIPPRRKKRPSTDSKINSDNEKTSNETGLGSEMYPDHLNPFTEDEEEEGEPVNSKLVSTNPFSSSDDDEETPASVANEGQADPPVKRLIAANPFWSDGEEPTTDEEEHNSSSLYQSVTTSTPNRQSTPQRRKVKAPPPPPPVLHVSLVADRPSASMEDVASLSSVSSFNSTVHSDQKSQKLTPMLKKRRPAPTPPDSISTMSGSSLHGGGGSLDHGVDTSGLCRRSKGPAPGLPLPERRAVRLQLSPAELQLQLDLLETQQLGLEKQGVLLERMIRDKCEGDEASPAPQEEVEDLVIQLCELVNEKNDLFRKQTELMYIRRQQRLEQEQADIEHEIRVIQSRPAVNRIDADKAREEQLVARLVQIVKLRDELVQQLDAERRRERQEDLAIAASIATKRAQRHSESNSSSMKSEVVTAPKKNKVKDKMKKQFKKAKHTLIPKKKDGSSEKREEEKEKKSKTSPKNKTEV